MLITCLFKRLFVTSCGFTYDLLISEDIVQSAIANAVKKAGIVKHVSVHTLRHSFATHLLQSGVNIREIQELLGHKSVETTMIYTHVLRDMQNVPQSPLDALYPESGS